MPESSNTTTPVSLLTPASDLATGGAQTDFEAILGRRGNDTFYGDAPGISNNPRNIDVLIGDIFDNSAQEFGIILAIQAGNPLAILDQPRPPSVGADRFVFGDGFRPYYVNPGGRNALTTTDPLGFNQFGVIYDFDPAQDVIQLNGSPADYLLVNVNGLQIQGIQQLFYGKAIFSLQQGVPDLVTYVIERPEVTLNLNDPYFQYVVDKPQTSPSEYKINQLGTTGIDQGNAAAADPSGNVYITGATSGPLEGPNQGNLDAWVAKFNSSGNQTLAKQIGTPNGDTAFSIATDNQGNFYVAGNTSGNLFSTRQASVDDAFVAKYDSNGNQLWAKQFQGGGFSNPSFGLDVDAAGNVYASGLVLKPNTNPVFNFPVQDDSFVAKFDTNGNQQWLTQVGGPFFDESYDLAVDKNGNSYISGWTQGLLRESDPSRPLLKYDSFLAKVNTAGQVQWIQQFGSTNQGLEFAWAVDTDSQNNIYVSGWTTGQLGTQQTQGGGNYDLYLAKFTPDGTEVWAKQIGSKGSLGDDATYLGDMVIDAQDNIFITGFTNDFLGNGNKDPNYNAVVAKFDTNGTNQWIQQFGSKGRLDYATGVTVDNAGKLYVTGFTDGFLGNNTGGNTGAVDAFLAQFDTQRGNLQKFTGDASAVTSITNPTAIPVVDITNTLVTAQSLPNGDNIINPSEGTNLSTSTFSYGQLVNGLANVFDPNGQSTFSTVFRQGVSNNNAPFLSASDLSALRR